MSNVCEEDTVVTVPQRLEVGEDSLEIMNSFHYVGDVVSCREGVKSALRDRISCTWSKLKELASLLVNHSNPTKEKATVCRTTIQHH